MFNTQHTKLNKNAYHYTLALVLRTIILKDMYAKDPGVSGVFEVQAAFAGDGGDSCLGNLNMLTGARNFKPCERGLCMKLSVPRPGVVGRRRQTNFLRPHVRAVLLGAGFDRNTAKDRKWIVLGDHGEVTVCPVRAALRLGRGDGGCGGAEDGEDAKCVADHGSVPSRCLDVETTLTGQIGTQAECAVHLPFIWNRIRSGF